MRFLIALAVLLGLSAMASAQKKYVIAIYAPNAPFASGTDRFNFASRLAQQISSVAGVQAEGKAFARAGDLEAAIKAKQVDFAVIDGVYLAQRGVPYQVLAIATTGGETQPKWALFAAAPGDPKSLQGKKLALPRSGPRDDDFVGNALFNGELSVKKFFSAKSETPDLVSALEAVKLHRADAVLAPISEGKGLSKIMEVDRVPNAAFCEVAGNTPSDVISKVKEAVIKHGAAAALDGWRSSDSGPYRALAGGMGSRSKRGMMAEPDIVKMEDLDILIPPQLEPSLPDLKSQFWMPTN
jgi:hypothetical protein